MKNLQDLSVSDYLKILRRRIWWMIIPALVASAGAFAYVGRMPSLYKSETTIMVSSRLLPEDYIGSVVRDTAEDQIQFVRQQFQSRSFVEQILRKSQVEDGTQQNMAGLVNSVLAGTEITMVSRGTFKVAYISSSPDHAQSVTRRLAEGVMMLNQTLRQGKVDAADKFLDDEVRRAANDLAAAEAAVRQFNRNNFPSMSEQGVSIEVLNNFERQLVTVDTNLESLTNQRKFLARRIEDQRQVMRLLQNLPGPGRPAEPAPQPVTVPSHTPTDSERMLASKEAELRDALARYTPEHPDVVRLTREVRRLEAQVSAKLSITRDATPPPKTAASEASAVSLPPLDPSEDLIQAENELELEQLDQQLAKQQQAKNELEGKISLLRKRLNLPPALAQQMATLTRDVEDAKQRYNVLTTKKMDLELAGSVDTNENNTLFKIVDLANFPRSPFSPNRPLYLAVGCLMGLGMGLGMGFLREFADSTFSDEDELSSELKMPVLASIPIVIPAKAADAGAANKPTLTLITSGETNDTATFSLRAADGKLKDVLSNPMTIAGEQYRLIRTSLSTMQKQQGLKCLVITSAIPGEGKSFVSACLAGILAQEPAKSVLLLQADIRTVNGSRLLGVHHREPRAGLSDVLQGSADIDEALLKCEELNLYLLPSGRPVHNPADLLSKPEFENLVRDVSQRFDWIIIDSPPILALSDARLIAASTDATLMVVRAEKTPGSLVKESVQKIGKDRVCGVVLNGARRIKASNYYGQYYQRTFPVKKKIVVALLGSDTARASQGSAGLEPRIGFAKNRKVVFAKA